MHVKTLSLGPLGTNCYIISKNKQCLIFDPGGNSEIITQYISENDLHPIAILLTHAHFDHIGAVGTIRHNYDIPVYLHEKEKDWLGKAELNRSLIYFGESGAIRTEKPEKLLTAGTLHIDPFQCEVIHTPGHSPGSVTFIFREEQFVISGDVLFHHGIGRTDLPEGNYNDLVKSISTQLYKLPDEFIVYPGHGTSTKIGIEKQTNPYTLQFFQL